MFKDSHSIEKFRHETGSTLLICLLVIMVLTTLALFGLQSATFEINASAAYRREKTNFTNAETGMKFAIAYFKLIYNNATGQSGSGKLYTEDSTGIGRSGDVYINSSGGLTVSSLPAGDTDTSLQSMPLGTGAVVLKYMAEDPGNTTSYIPIARVEIRAIMVSPPAISGLSSDANNVPGKFHLGPAPEGYSNTLFASRNYIITSTALDKDGDATNTTLQCGVYVAALRTSVAHLKGL